MADAPPLTGIDHVTDVPTDVEATASFNEAAPGGEFVPAPTGDGSERDDRGGDR